MAIYYHSVPRGQGDPHGTIVHPFKDDFQCSSHLSSGSNISTMATAAVSRRSMANLPHLQVYFRCSVKDFTKSYFFTDKALETIKKKKIVHIIFIEEIARPLVHLGRCSY